jgi:hypothetical protein
MRDIRIGQEISAKFNDNFPFSRISPHRILTHDFNVIKDTPAYALAVSDDG